MAFLSRRGSRPHRCGGPARPEMGPGGPGLATATHGPPAPGSGPDAHPPPPASLALRSWAHRSPGPPRWNALPSPAQAPGSVRGARRDPPGARVSLRRLLRLPVRLTQSRLEHAARRVAGSRHSPVLLGQARPEFCGGGSRPLRQPRHTWPSSPGNVPVATEQQEFFVLLIFNEFEC